jgi:hypothetical protein
MTIFNSFLYVYQRVNHETILYPPEPESRLHFPSWDGLQNIRVSGLVLHSTSRLEVKQTVLATIVVRFMP